MVNIIRVIIDWNNNVVKELGWVGCILLMIGALWASQLVHGTLFRMIMFILIYIVLLDIGSGGVERFKSKFKP